MSKQSKVLIRMNEELHNKLKFLADSDNRSLNNYLVTLLEKHVKDAIEDNLEVWYEYDKNQRIHNK